MYGLRVLHRTIKDRKSKKKTLAANTTATGVANLSHLYPTCREKFNSGNLLEAPTPVQTIFVELTRI